MLKVRAVFFFIRLLGFTLKLGVSDYRNIWNTKSWKSFDEYVCINQLFCYKTIIQNGVGAFSKIDDTLFTKTKNFISFVLSNDVQILWHKHLLRNYKKEFQTPDVSTSNGNIKYPIGISTCHTDFCVQTLSCFHCYY